jgi:beta-lactamase class A
VAWRAAALLLLLAVGREPAFAQAPLGALQGRLEARAAAHRGVVGIAVIDLQTGDSLAIRGEEPFPTASVIKVPILVELFHQVQHGRLRLEDPLVLLEADKKPGSGILQHFAAPHQLTVADAAFLMIAHSDNTATNLLIDKVGIHAVGSRMDSLGLTRTTLHSKLFSRESSIAPDSSARYGVGVTTPLEMARLFALLHQGKAVSAQASAQMVELLKKQFYRAMIPRHLPGVTVANKTGSVDAARVDCGIVDAAARAFVLCVFTKENQDRSWRLDNEAEVLIGDVARIVHGGLTRETTR